MSCQVKKKKNFWLSGDAGEGKPQLLDSIWIKDVSLQASAGICGKHRRLGMFQKSGIKFTRVDWSVLGDSQRSFDTLLTSFNNNSKMNPQCTLSLIYEASLIRFPLKYYTAQGLETSFPIYNLPQPRLTLPYFAHVPLPVSFFLPRDTNL